MRYVNKLSSIVMFLLHSEPTFWPQSKEFFLENLQLAAGKNEISWWVKHARRNSTNQFELNVKIENSSNYSGPGIICNKSCHVVVDRENISLWFCHLLLSSALIFLPWSFFFAAIQCLSPSLGLALLNLKMLPINRIGGSTSSNYNTFSRIWASRRSATLTTKRRLDGSPKKRESFSLQHFSTSQWSVHFHFQLSLFYSVAFWPSNWLNHIFLIDFSCLPSFYFR